MQNTQDNKKDNKSTECVYYDPVSGIICDRYPNVRQKTEESAMIELTLEDYNKTLACGLGKCWAIVDGRIAEIDDIDYQKTDDYKKNKLGDEMCECQYYLNATDYVISKLNELKLEDDDEYAEMKIKYADILAERKTARKRIREIEEEMKAFDKPSSDVISSK